MEQKYRVVTFNQGDYNRAILVPKNLQFQEELSHYLTKFNSLSAGAFRAILRTERGTPKFFSKSTQSYLDFLHEFDEGTGKNVQTIPGQIFFLRDFLADKKLNFLRSLSKENSGNLRSRMSKAGLMHRNLYFNTIFFRQQLRVSLREFNPEQLQSIITQVNQLLDNGEAVLGYYEGCVLCLFDWDFIDPDCRLSEYDKAGLIETTIIEMLEDPLES